MAIKPSPEALLHPLRAPVQGLLQALQAGKRRALPRARQEMLHAAQRILSSQETIPQVQDESVPLQVQSCTQACWHSFETHIALAHLLSEAALLCAGDTSEEEQLVARNSLEGFLAQTATAEVEQPAQETTSRLAEHPPAGADGRQEAVNQYRQTVLAFYDTLLETSRALVLRAYQNLSAFDLAKVLADLKKLLALDAQPAQSQDELAAQALTSLAQATHEVQRLHQIGVLQKLEEEIKVLWEAIHQGADALSGLLAYTFGSQSGAAQITAWLQATQAPTPQLNHGAGSIQELTTQWKRLIETYGRLFQSLERLHALGAWLEGRATLNFPLETLLLSVYIVSLDVALLQGMDYADTARLIQWVPGVMVISKAVLGMDTESPTEDG